MVLTVWLRIVALVIDPKKEEWGNVVHHIISLKLSPSINWTYVIRRIMNTKAINIGRQQVIGRYGMFNFESCQRDILAHVHDHCNILYGGTCMLWLFMDDLIFASFLQITCLDFFANVMKGCAALLLCILYFALPFQHQWWHWEHLYLHKHNYHHNHHHHQ